MVRTKGARNKPALGVTERLQKVDTELMGLQEAVKAERAEIKELKRGEKSEAQQVTMKTVEENGETAEEILAMIQRQ